jgi:anaerobic selenocysteine-containing dehydrogenase/Fe-S-cluster-containing dehydrogenase component
MNRRTFLKLASMGSVAVAAGCSGQSEDHLFAMVRATEDMVTGQETWYASTCRECPSGCGVLAKNREGRAVKLEGNPLHPINRGKLCARGHAALQRLYHPDRLQEPLLKVNGRWETIAFDRACETIRHRLERAAAKGPGRAAMLTEVAGQGLLDLFEAVLARYDGQVPLVFEPFAHESLKFAHQALFGRPALPTYRIDQADLLVGFGADFLESWLSPVEYGRRFKAMHAWGQGSRGRFVQVSPFQSLTGANADRWLACRPGGQALVAMALIRQLLAAGWGMGLPGAFRSALAVLAAPYTTAVVARQADLDPGDLQWLFEQLRDARRPLVLPTETAAHGAGSAAADLASLLLNLLLDPTFVRVDFSQPHRVEIAATRAQAQAFWDQLSAAPAELLLLNQVNPLYTLPDSARVAQVLAHPDLFVVALTHLMDETAAAADLILPLQHPLESWDLYESKQAMLSTLQPTVGRNGDAPGIGDLFLDLLPAAGRPATDYRHYLMQRLLNQGTIATPMDWLRLVQGGGHFGNEAAGPPEPRLDQTPLKALADLLAARPPAESGQRIVQVCASLRFYDGRHADRPWLPEIPDPVSQVAWQTVAMVHPQTLTSSGAAEGRMVVLATAHGQVTLHAYSHPGLHPDMLVIPAGQGHTQMGRYAQDQGVNPVALLAAGVDPLSGAPDYSAPIVRLAPGASGKALASVSGSRFQHGRKIAVSVPAAHADTPEPLGKYLDMDHFPLTLPLPEGYDPRRDFYPAHDHDTYRWAMVVDLDRCTGCSACVAACYAENSVGVVGEDQVIAGREMAWIRIERYQDAQDPTRLIFLPMLCQHCDNAPCESVCPVYAPHHSTEGLNNQIYNRCIGTRYCGQNCPYKVRRFNWFTWQWPEPLNLQLNPDVTVRSAGVMEKCSFCVQRIKAARTRAKNQQREIRDGEVVPACVQTCPTQALIFGNLMDRESAVRRKVDDPRAYQVMGYLNTKPAVIYLKKVTQRV